MSSMKPNLSHFFSLWDLEEVAVAEYIEYQGEW
jgi:hypothetical protein